MEFEELNKRITFYDKKTKKDSNGELKDSFEVVFSCWSGVSKASIREFANSEKERKMITLCIRFEHLSQVKNELVFSFNDQTQKMEKTIYRVTSYEPDFKNHELLLIKGECVNW